MSLRIPALAFLVALSLSMTSGQSIAEESPAANTFRDAQLKWGPCPAFMPKGCEIAVLHGDPASDNADVFFKIPANAKIPAHAHTSAERMVLVSGELQVIYDGQKPVTLKPGMYAYGPPKLAHEASCAKAEACILFIAFNSPIDAYETALGKHE
jgi:quercetin dioxygenase-like cupin family protein